MRGNPVGYRNLYKHLRELLNFLEISLDSDFVLEELSNALYECETVFGKKHQLTNQLRKQFRGLHAKYIERKALPLEGKDERKLREKIYDWLKKYYKQPPI
ncbi:MAG: hypothetical protein DRP02_02800 [Candidatus Gerdarchaeota archaeon]|nr:MAG: hypothetical protein DRP02_02800 [Candidatus Gerdarchaeota archaeon]